MRGKRKFTIAGLALLGLGFGCSRGTPVQPEQVEVIRARRTAMEVIRQVHDSLEADCGQRLAEIDLSGLAELEIHEPDQADADVLLEKIGLYAQQCGSYDPPVPAGTCEPGCDWCPVEWHWCLRHAGACAGGEHTSCCHLGACGSRRHCEESCGSSCGCYPSSGGAGSDE